ncbi:hypothetical protein POM88_021080 [Heracleum sosnowskyi]|uniref:Uncharacterized protein n=1 Tax=Heracleum sosnowskyi TaxID=360622 RepID=A0AAD8ICY5_9APIA|nr:hypothetical protein POM88_021080 [Heracleum sosnowskyi]
MEYTTPNHVPDTPNPIPNTTPEITPNITSNITLNTTPIELKSPKKEDDDEPLTQKRKPTRTSDVWEHFTKIKVYGLTSKNTRKIRKRCWIRSNNYLALKRRKVELRICWWLHKVRCRNVLDKFVVKDEQAFKVVEGEGFKELVQELQPMFVVPSRVTIARVVHHLYFKERAKLMEVLTTTGQRQGGLKLDIYIDEMHAYEFLEEDNPEKNKVKDHAEKSKAKKSSIIDVDE